MLLIDLDYLKSTQQELWSNAICQRFGEASAVLLNAPTSTNKELLLMWPHTSGLFFRQDTLDRLVFGIRKVLQEYWIRATCCATWWTTTARERATSASADAADRPRAGDRASPDDGASNTEIADSLFVSEHTVKSHLYNVFKKLNVKNRLQAVSWAKEYL